MARHYLYYTHSRSESRSRLESVRCSTLAVFRNWFARVVSMFDHSLQITTTEQRLSERERMRESERARKKWCNNY